MLRSRAVNVRQCSANWASSRALWRQAAHSHRVGEDVPVYEATARRAERGTRRRAMRRDAVDEWRCRRARSMAPSEPHRRQTCLQQGRDHDPTARSSPSVRGARVSATDIDIADASTRARGAPAAQVFAREKGEQLLTLVAPGDEYLVLVTRIGRGQTNRSPPEDLAENKGVAVINLKPGDRVSAAFTSPESVDIVTSPAMAMPAPRGRRHLGARCGAGAFAGIGLRATPSSSGPGRNRRDQHRERHRTRDGPRPPKPTISRPRAAAPAVSALRGFPTTNASPRLRRRVVGPARIDGVGRQSHQTDPIRRVSPPADKRDLVSVQTERRIHAAAHCEVKETTVGKKKTAAKGKGLSGKQGPSGL